MTSAPSTLSNLQAKLVQNLHTVNLGIVGDAAHIRSGGYHIGAASLRSNGMSGDYSLEFSLDKNATHDFACAFDIGGSSDQLMTIGNRLVHALENHDPRVYGKVRAVNAPFDGQSVDRRYDTENPSTPADDHTESSSDRNHVHVEIYRTLVTNQAVIDGVYSVIAGVGLTTPVPPVKPTPPISHPTPGKLAVDGVLGPNTIKAWQNLMHTPADGKISSPSDLVRAVQKVLKAKVDSSLVVDGLGIAQNGRSSRTITALQRYLKTPVDGVMSLPVSSVVKAVQTRINSGSF